VNAGARITVRTHLIRKGSKVETLVKASQPSMTANPGEGSAMKNKNADMELPGFGHVETMGGPSEVRGVGRNTERSSMRQTRPSEGEVKISEGYPRGTNLEVPQTGRKSRPLPLRLKE
jgi:hypothetical protein